MIRLAASVVLIILLAGCERSFDQRYDDTAGAIENQANSIDGDLENSSAQERGTGESRT